MAPLSVLAGAAMKRPGIEIPADAVAHAKRGDKITAIKITREHTGLGLKEAKDAVDAYLANPGGRVAAATVGGRPPAVEIPRAAMIALENGRLVEAVKHYREAHGGGLKDAKEALERHLADNPALHAKFRTASSAALRRVFGKLAGILLVLGLVTIVYFYVTGQIHQRAIGDRVQAQQRAE